MTHPESMELLPWYATLDKELQRQLDEHRTSCPECVREMAEIEAMQKDMQRIDDTPEPSPFLLQRTLSRIESHEAEKASRPTGLRGLLAWWRLSPGTARLMIAAQAALVVVLAVSALYYRQQAQEFSTLSGSGSAQGGARFVVRFQPGTSEEALRTVVQQIKGTIVEGPSALGLYTIQIPKDAQAEPVLEQLRTNANVGFVNQVPE